MPKGDRPYSRNYGKPKVKGQTKRCCVDCSTLLSVYNSADRCFSCNNKRHQEQRLNNLYG